MEIETVTKLIDAGYTKEEIEKLQPVGSAGSETPENVTEVKNDETPTDTGALENAPDYGEMIKTLTATVQGLTDTVKAMQQQNVSGANSDSAHGTDKVKETIDSFINSL